MVKGPKKPAKAQLTLAFVRSGPTQSWRGALRCLERIGALDQTERSVNRNFSFGVPSVTKSYHERKAVGEAAKPNSLFALRRTPPSCRACVTPSRSFAVAGAPFSLPQARGSSELLVDSNDRSLFVPSGAEASLRLEPVLLEPDRRFSSNEVWECHVGLSQALFRGVRRLVRAGRGSRKFNLVAVIAEAMAVHRTASFA